MRNRFADIVMALVVAGIMLGYVFPVAMDGLAAANTTAWNTAAASLWDVMQLLFVLVPFLALITYAVYRGRKQ